MHKIARYFCFYRSKSCALSTQQIVEEKEESSYLNDYPNRRSQPELAELPITTKMSEPSIPQQHNMPTDYWLGELHFNTFLTNEFFEQREEESPLVKASPCVLLPTSFGLLGVQADVLYCCIEKSY
jgi:hypothetical protein